MAAAIKSVVTSGSKNFVPRSVFEASPDIIKTYFLGHHAAAIGAMQRLLSNIGLIIECRDSRIPITSANPILESSLAGRERIIVYTKWSLSFPANGKDRQQSREIKRLLVDWNAECEGVRDMAADSGKTKVKFTEASRSRTIQQLLDPIRQRAASSDSLTGLRALVVGMPNSGKSTLLNAMREVGMNVDFKHKVAKTGESPGVTRKIAESVRIIPANHEAGIEQGVYVFDTPGVFVPHVKDVQSMLKLSLVGCVKDGVVPFEIMADYLLFHVNLKDTAIYEKYCHPTNDVGEFLGAVATRTGKLLKGGEPDREAAAIWVVKQWRKGLFGRFMLDELSWRTLQEQAAGRGEERPSLNQARKQEKEARKARNLARRQAANAS